MAPSAVLNDVGASLDEPQLSVMYVGWEHMDYLRLPVHQTSESHATVHTFCVCRFIHDRSCDCQLLQPESSTQPRCERFRALRS